MYDSTTLSDVPNDWHWHINFPWNEFEVRVDVWIDGFGPTDSLEVEIVCCEGFLEMMLMVDTVTDSYQLTDALGDPFHAGQWSAYPSDIPPTCSITGDSRRNTVPVESGACCTPGGGCIDGLDQATCEIEFEGTFAGDGTSCGGDCNGNGIFDACDIVSGTSQDCDGNGIPDECEPDCNANGIVDECDIDPADPDGNGLVSADCDGGNGNGVPDECEFDCNDNGVADSCDIVRGFSLDGNGNGVPDECELVSPPILAPPPHNILKNRYISIDPRGANGTNPNAHHIKVTLDSTEVLGVDAGQIGSVWWATGPDANCISILGPTQPASEPNWVACPILHLTGCSIIPTATYSIATVSGAGVESAPLVAVTQLKPADEKWWGDAVGFFTGPDGKPPNAWTGPQGVTNFDDVNACLRTFINPAGINATHTSVTDIHPNRPDLGGTSVHPNKLVSIDDVFQFIQAFQGHQYPGGDLAGCTDP